MDLNYVFLFLCDLLDCELFDLSFVAYVTNMDLIINK
jgi:hypothetical protein